MARPFQWKDMVWKVHDGLGRRRGLSSEPLGPRVLEELKSRQRASVPGAQAPRQQWGSQPLSVAMAAPLRDLISHLPVLPARSISSLPLQHSSPHHQLRCLPARAVWAEGTLGPLGLRKCQSLPSGSRSYSVWFAQSSQGQAVSWSVDSGRGLAGTGRWEGPSQACWDTLLASGNEGSSRTATACGPHSSEGQRESMRVCEVAPAVKS